MPSAAQKISTDELIAQHQAEITPTDQLIKAHQSELKAQRVPNTEVESYLKGGLEGITAGVSNNVQAIGKAAVDAYEDPNKRGLNELITSYRKYRGQGETESEQANQDNPLSYMAGQATGTALMSFVPGLGWMNVAKGASTASKIGTALKAGSLLGAGRSKADLTKGEVGDFVKDIVQGAVTGGVVQGVLSGTGSVVSGITDRFKNLPETRAVKAITGQNISALRQISDTTFKGAGDIGSANQRIVKVGRDILDEPGVLGPLSKVEDIAPKLAEARTKYGKLIGEVGSQIDALAPGAVDAKNIANKIVSYAESIPETLQGQKLRDKLVEEAANFEKIGALSFEDAQKFKNQFKYKAVDADALISNQDATNKVRGIIASEMDQTAESLSKQGPPEVQDLLKNYSLYKSKYGSFKGASDAATDRVQKNITNRFVSPSDYGVGATIGLAQSIAHGAVSPSTVLLGAGAAMANKFARERGSALAAKTADGILKAYESQGVQGLVQAAKPVLDAARKGNASAVLTFQLLNQSNPKAIQLLNQQDAMQRRGAQ